MTIEQGIMLQIALLVALLIVWVALRVAIQIRTLRTLPDGESPALPIPMPEPEPMIHDLTVVHGTRGALAHPPADLRTAIQFLRQHYPHQPYTAPLGWRVVDDAAAESGQRVECVALRFVNDTNHMLITAQSDGGKDAFATNILLSLAVQHGPDEVQVAIIDGKGLDWVKWHGKAHTWRLAIEPESIKPAMDALSAERIRRTNVLRAAGVEKWDAYRPAPGDPPMPLLVVYVSELSLLEDAVGKGTLTDWLNTELTSGRAFGIRYMIATQTASNFNTRWRSQIGLYIAGFQPSASQDQPNTGLTTQELRQRGGTPPSELPAPPMGAGVLTCVHNREVVTVRSGFISGPDRAEWLRRLPDAPSKVERVSDAGSGANIVGTTGGDTPADANVGKGVGRGVGTATNAVGNSVGVPLDDSSADAANGPQKGTNDAVMPTVLPPPTPAEMIDIPDDERRRILEAAATHPSRRKVCEAVYGSISGRMYKRIKAVLGPEQQGGDQPTEFGVSP